MWTIARTKLRTTTICSALSLSRPLRPRKFRDFSERFCYYNCDLVVLTIRTFTTFAHRRGHSCCLIYMSRQLIVSTFNIQRLVFIVFCETNFSSEKFPFSYLLQPLVKMSWQKFPPTAQGEAARQHLTHPAIGGDEWRARAEDAGLHRKWRPSHLCHVG